MCANTKSTLSGTQLCKLLQLHNLWARIFRKGILISRNLRTQVQTSLWSFCTRGLYFDLNSVYQFIGLQYYIYFSCNHFDFQ